MRDLSELEYETHGPETEESISDLESMVGVSLPSELRQFLLQFGGGYLTDCMIECREHTPFGELNIIEIESVRGISVSAESDILPRNMLSIGTGHFSKWTCISIAGVDRGKIYAFDAEMRYYWDQDTLDKLPALDPSIKEFFRLRDNEELPERPWGYENCYEVADNFNDFLDRLEVYE